MNIVVCVKRVPLTEAAEVVVDKDGKDIKKDALPHDINEWDNFALEEALLLKEKFGGSVTAITVGPDASDEVLRVCLAKGADNAIRLGDAAFENSDAYATAKVLYSTIKNLNYDLIFTGTQASDDNSGQVGPTLARMLGISHVVLVSKIESINIESKIAKVQRELEGGYKEVLEVGLPALFAVQTGINEPRYASIMGIRKAAKKKIDVLNLKNLGLTPEDVGVLGSKSVVERVYIPPMKQAELIKGTPEEVAKKLVEIFKGAGVI